MPKENKQRALHIYKYLLDNTDDDHPATIKDITAYLSGIGIDAGRQTISDDVDELQACGFDIIKNRSTQNQYFIGSRVLELSELKMLVDAVQAARFITHDRAKDLIKRLTTLASPHQAGELKRKLYVESRAADANVLAVVDMLYKAMQTKRTMTFLYCEYSPEKKHKHKHNGQLYEMSPYDLLWNNDRYYVLGYSKTHEGIRTFRVDRIDKPELTARSAVLKPKDYRIEDYRNRVFLMYDGPRQTVELLCDNDMMDAVVDKFGKKVQTAIVDDGHFSVTGEVSIGSTFFAWVFNYAGKIRIQSPEDVRSQYREHLGKAARSL